MPARSVIVSALRTPFGKLGGGLAAHPATELGGLSTGEAVPTLLEVLAILSWAIVGGYECEQVKDNYRDLGHSAFTASSAYFTRILGGGLGGLGLLLDRIGILIALAAAERIDTLGNDVHFQMRPGDGRFHPRCGLRLLVLLAGGR